MGTGPDPEAARTPAELVQTMRQLRSWADLSYRQLERRAADTGDVLPRTTISGVLAREDLPREELLGAFVRACGGDAATVEAWLEVRRRLAMNTQPPPGRDRESPPASADAIPAIADQTSPLGEPAPAPSVADRTASEQPSDDGTPAGVETGLAADDEDPPTANAPSPQAPVTAPNRGRPPSRTRHLPMTLTGACAAVGVLIFAFWHYNVGQPDSARPENSARITGVPTKSTPTPTPSATPSPDTSTPTAARTSSGLVETGWVEMHPYDAPSRCITEGTSELTERSVAVRDRCSDLDYPQINLKYLGGLVYQLEQPFMQNCLGGDGNETDTSPSGVSPWECTDPRTQYGLELSGNGYRLRLIDSSMCLGMQDLTDGGELIQAKCTGASDQVFTFTRAQAPS